MTNAYEVSILGMLAMPFLIFGVLGFLLWRASRVPPPRDTPGSGSLREPDKSLGTPPRSAE